jgi:hypothetical protein
MRKLMLAAGMALALTGTAPAVLAQELSSTPITHFNADNVSALLTKIGAQNVTSSKDADGTTTIVFEVSGAKYRGVLLVCKTPPNCLGLLLGIGVATEGTFSTEVVNSFNGGAPFGKAYRSKDGKVVILFRYVISDYGILEANVASNIANFTGMPAAFQRHVANQTIASNQDGKPATVNLTSTKPGAAAVAADVKAAIDDKAAKTVGLKLPSAPEHGDLTSFLESFAKDPAYKITK